MKKFLIFSLLLFSVSILRAQDYRMISLEEINKMSARENIREDEKQRQCAVIQISTQDILPEMRQGFHFDADYATEVVDNAIVDGEIWIWVSPGMKTLKIHHNSLGSIEVPITKYNVKIESLHTYRMVLKGTMKVVKDDGTPKVTQQFLVLEINPKDAMVIVDNKPWLVDNGIATDLVTFGPHTVVVEAPDCHPFNETINVEYSENSITKKITLKPAFGYLKIVGDQKVLNESTIYINTTNGADAVKGPMKLTSGKYKVRVLNRNYTPFERDVTIVDGETYTLNVNMNSNFSAITLQVNADADIYVNNVKKGTRSWTGEMPAGTYVIECKMKGHKTSRVEKTITQGMSGTTIQLDVPKPINGTLVVNTTPPMAKLFVDDVYEGETPKQVNALLIGEHKIKIEKSGFATTIKTITIEENKTLNLNEKLEAGKTIQIKSEEVGDMVYVDGNYVGKTPVFATLQYGSHKVKVVRGSNSSEKTIEIKEGSKEQDFFFEFGRLTTITTDRSGDQIFIDGKKVGVSPISLDLSYGSHTILAKRGNMKAEKEIQVTRSSTTSDYYLRPAKETAEQFVQNGVYFMTVNGAFNIDGTLAPDQLLSYGACLGMAKQFGFFISATSNFSQNALAYDIENDSNGLIDGYFPSYTDEGYLTRRSIVAGLLYQLSGPSYLRVGAGYGQRHKSLYVTDGRLVHLTGESFEGVDVMVGYQLNLKGFTFSVDFVTTNFGAFEANLGLGFCIKRK